MINSVPYVDIFLILGFVTMPIPISVLQGSYLLSNCIGNCAFLSFPYLSIEENQDFYALGPFIEIEFETNSMHQRTTNDWFKL